MADLKYMNYKGCGACELSKQNIDCKKIHVLVKITFKKAERADCWGRMVTVFRKGESVQGHAVIKDNKVYCASAASNLYEEYEDFVGLENIKVELVKE